MSAEAAVNRLLAIHPKGFDLSLERVLGLLQKLGKHPPSDRPALLRTARAAPHHSSSGRFTGIFFQEPVVEFITGRTQAGLSAESSGMRTAAAPCRFFFSFLSHCHKAATDPPRPPGKCRFFHQQMQQVCDCCTYFLSWNDHIHHAHAQRYSAV